MTEFERPVLSSARARIVEQVLQIVDDNVGRHQAPLQHVLLTGGPGSGKTALLNAITEHLQHGPKFPGVMVSYLASTVAAQAAAPETFLDWATDAVSKPPARLAPFPWRGGDEDAWEESIERLEAALDLRFGVGRGLAVLLFDDFEDILRRVFWNQEAESRLRRLLQENPRVMVVAATRDGQVQSDYDRPLFQIFQPIDLPPFDVREAFGSGARIWDLAPRGAAYLAAAYFILGPFQPRRLVLAHKLSELVTSASDLIRALADAEDLSFGRLTQQLAVRPARLLDALLVGGEPSRPAALADRLGTVQSDIAPTLRDLLTPGIIERSEGSGGRLTFYQASDRLFATWYLDRRERGLAPGPTAADLVAAGILLQPNPFGDHAAEGLDDGVRLANFVRLGGRRADAFKIITSAWADWHAPDGAQRVALHALVALLIRRPTDPTLLLELGEAAEVREGWGIIAAVLKAAALTRFDDPNLEQGMSRPLNLDKNYRPQPDLQVAIRALRSAALLDVLRPESRADEPRNADLLA